MPYFVTRQRRQTKCNKDLKNINVNLAHLHLISSLHLAVLLCRVAKYDIV